MPPGSQPPARKQNQGGPGEWLRSVNSFQGFQDAWHRGKPGVRPPLKALEADPEKRHREGKNYSCQIESFKDCIFTLEVLKAVKGLTVEQLQQQANQQWVNDAAKAKGPNKNRVGRQWSGHRKWLEDTHPECFLAGRVLKKNPSMSAHDAYEGVQGLKETLATPSRALKKARVAAGLHSPDAASVNRALQFGEPMGTGSDVASCADTFITQLQEKARALAGRSESQSFKEVAEEVELSKLSQLATALSLPTTDPSKRGQQGLCGYSLYLSMKRAGMEALHPGLQPSQITQLLASAWNDVGAAVQSGYKMYAAIVNRLEGRK
ncbi:hypothetical protein [Bosea sp. (in: a-proteobacteria)]|uniref:hypothetical protein n=1 Tax=Bosea sp. (in: a-proteobacteria) TaxID=1871050 RepID=UPI004034197C